jgi:GDPmannose 4,6-dehydratase
VPPVVLNAPSATQRAYLDGFHAGDGMSAARGASVKTTSPVLALGLYWLYANQGRPPSVEAEAHGDRTDYQLHLPTEEPGGQPGLHPQVAPATARRIEAAAAQPEWLFDLETGSGTFMAGVGPIVVKNSPRRGLEFVTHKITDGVARIALGLAGDLHLGNLESRRDWGWAPDYVRAMWMMLQATEATDYVIATGQTHSVLEFCEAAFGHVGLDWRGYVVSDPRFMRPAEVDFLVGDASKARDQLGWQPSVGFEDMVARMVEADLTALDAEREKA